MNHWRELTDRCRDVLIASGILNARKDRTTYPKDASGTAILGAEDHGMTVRLSPSGAVNRRLHRIHVACYQCGSWQDAGHFSQHVDSAKCKATAAKRMPSAEDTAIRLSFAATFRAEGRCASIYQTAELAGVATPDQIIVSQAGTRGATNAILVHDPFQREERVSAGMVRYSIGQATMTWLDRLNEASAL